MRHPASRTSSYLLPALFVALAAAPPRPAAAQTTKEAVRARSDKAHRELDCEAGRCVNEEEPAAPARPEAKPVAPPVVKSKPAAPPEVAPKPAEPPAKPRPAVKPEPAPEPAPRRDPPPAPPKRRAVPVTLYWHMADDADVYLNGSPLRPYSPSFKTRPDEAPLPAFSAKAELADGDVFTVGGRRGGSFGFMLIATDASGAVVFMTDQRAWKVYKPGEREDWFKPETARSCESEPVTVQPSPWGPQTTLNGQHGNKASSIWSAPSERFAYLHGTVRLPGAGEFADRAISVRSVNYPARLIRLRDFLAVLSDVETEEASFKKVPGLADPSALSFESASRPGHFLRHQGGRLKLHQDSGDRLFKEDATFKTVPGLADAAAVSFESFNYPGHFIRHRDFQLFIEKGSDELFRQDATFSLVDSRER
ncbi:MAG: AbfB domain-containing protein [Elusimicrobia bacterium]|nr:AbfB domain-containing protein [Elusimicrobiota bacterium]